MQVQTVIVGGKPISDPILITSIPNSVAGEGRQQRADPGHRRRQPDRRRDRVRDRHLAFVLSGLIIDGFAIGVSVPQPGDMGNLIQGNFIGQYLLYPVDPVSGQPLPSPNNVILAGLGNSQQGIYLNANNTTVGGTNPQENNVISGNGLQGDPDRRGGDGNVVEGNQIGMIGPSDERPLRPGRQRRRGVLVYGLEQRDRRARWTARAT